MRDIFPLPKPDPSRMAQFYILAFFWGMTGLLINWWPLMLLSVLVFTFSYRYDDKSSFSFEEEDKLILEHHK